MSVASLACAPPCLSEPCAHAGVGRGAIVTIHLVTCQFYKKRNGVYLRALDVSQFCIDQAPRGDWADQARLPLAPTSPAVQIGRIILDGQRIIDCSLMRLRVCAASHCRLRAGQRAAIFWR